MTMVEANEPWLGRVPGEWKRSRIRNEALLSPGFSSAPPTPAEICTIVPMDSISTDGAIDSSNQQPFEEIPPGLTLFEQGDVLFAKITPCMENGKGAFVPELPTRYSFGSTEYHVLRPRHGLDGRFLYHATFNLRFPVACYGDKVFWYPLEYGGPEGRCGQKGSALCMANPLPHGVSGEISQGVAG